jgi:hypothetical protein
MNPKQAKDFLRQQTAEQAALEGVPFSDIEKRMMYFTESDASCENPLELNEKFEAQFDTQKYEAKISRLLLRARERLKREDPAKARTWDQSIRALRKGDHYILVLWDINPPSEHRIRDSFQLLGLSLLLVAGIGVAAVLAAKYNISLDRFRGYLPAPNPRRELILYVAQALLVFGGLRLFIWMPLDWFQRRSREDKESK